MVWHGGGAGVERSFISTGKEENTCKTGIQMKSGMWGNFPGAIELKKREVDRRGKRWHKGKVQNSKGGSGGS